MLAGLAPAAGPPPVYLDLDVGRMDPLMEPPMGADGSDSRGNGHSTKGRMSTASVGVSGQAGFVPPTGADPPTDNRSQS